MQSKWCEMREAVLCLGILDTEAQSEGLWLVQVRVDDIRAMTLEELEAALKTRVINEHTLVLRDGSFQWTELGWYDGEKTVELGTREQSL